MSVIEHLPPTTLNFTKSEQLLFWAGPIQGAPDWQSRASSIIREMYSSHDSYTDLHIANPRREYLDDTFDWDKQVEWEEDGLERAARNGGVLFWLAKHDPSLPYEKGRAYGQTTRFEYGDMIRRKLLIPSTKIVLGIEPGYVGSERYYRKKAAKFPDMEVVNDLEAACSALMAVIERRQ